MSKKYFIFSALSALFLIEPLSAHEKIIVMEEVAPAPMVVVEQAPPADAVEKIPLRPGLEWNWIPGHWKWDNKWTWHGGYWTKRPAGYTEYVPGHWREKHHRWIWVEGHWK